MHGHEIQEVAGVLGDLYELYGLQAKVSKLVTGVIRWRLEYRHMSSPAARLLLGEPGDPGGPFALFGRVGRSPRVYACRDREAVMRQMQTAALNKMGMTLAGESLNLNLLGRATDIMQREFSKVL